jgi:hypothetical protein
MKAAADEFLLRTACARAVGVAVHAKTRSRTKKPNCQPREVEVPIGKSPSKRMVVDIHQ